MGKIGSTEAIDEAGQHLLVQQFTLRVLGGEQDGMTYSSRGSTVTIGTHPLTDLALQDKTMSRFHCEIGLESGRARIRDLGSRNGTEVDGVAIESAFLRDGSVLQIGRTRIRFETSMKRVKLRLSEHPRFGELVGSSTAMRSVFARLEHAAASDATVLLLGETGTGKEVAAESIHRAGPRKDGPFVVVDCGAIPESLLETELFGYERGAFTGADRARAGLFEVAHGGTLFLDEIGELGLDLQPKLLRATETRAIQRVGGVTRIPADVRIIAATNRSLRGDVNAGRFRSDLYYRLAVLEIYMPALRERLEDLPLLVETLVRRMGSSEPAVTGAVHSERFLAELRRHHWPGNIRELRNYVERFVTLGGQVTPPAPEPAHDAPPSIDIRQPIQLAREQWIIAFERRYLEELLRVHRDNVAEAARAAGVARRHFYRLLSRAGIERGEGEP